jgi:hypothetical protein
VKSMIKSAARFIEIDKVRSKSCKAAKLAKVLVSRGLSRPGLIPHWFSCFAKGRIFWFQTSGVTAPICLKRMMPLHQSGKSPERHKLRSQFPRVRPDPTRSTHKDPPTLPTMPERPHACLSSLARRWVPLGSRVFK